MVGRMGAATEQIAGLQRRKFKANSAAGLGCEKKLLKLLSEGALLMKPGSGQTGEESWRVIKKEFQSEGCSDDHQFLALHRLVMHLAKRMILFQRLVCSVRPSPDTVQ